MAHLVRVGQRHLVGGRGDDDPGHHDRVQEVVGRAAEPSRVVRGGDDARGLASALRSKYSHHRPTLLVSATAKAAISVPVMWARPDSVSPDDHDRLAQRDEHERLAPLGEVPALDRPLVRGRAAQPRGVEADDPAQQVHADRGHPQRHPRAAGREPARDGQRAADQAPAQDALEVALQALAPQRDHREHAAADLHDRVRAADGQPAGPERVGQGGGHHQADPGQAEQQQPDRDPLRVQPVGDPRGVDPQLPDHGQQQRRCRSAPVTLAWASR